MDGNSAVFDVSFTGGSSDLINTSVCFDGVYAPQVVVNNDYNALQNRPSIERHLLEGDSTLEQIGVDLITAQAIDQIIYG